jgi:SAM-dependent methyltransferase
MTDVWSQRADAFRDSRRTAKARTSTCSSSGASLGGRQRARRRDRRRHSRRRLREQGCTVVTVDPAPGMQPDVVAPADHLPFADGSFDVVTCRIAAHHFPDIAAAVKEMARVSKPLLVIEDNVFGGERVEEAERCATRRTCAATARTSGRTFVTTRLEVEQIERFEPPQSVDAWLERVDTPPETRRAVRELLATTSTTTASSSCARSSSKA